MLIVALSVCGCSKKSPPPEAASVPPQAAPVAESNTPAPPNKNEHPVLITTREFLRAINAGNYRRALSFSIPDEITEQSLKSMHDTPFQWDQATFAQVWVGKEQAAVITNPVPAKDSPITITWAFNLVTTDDGQWLVRLTDILKTPEEAEDYVAALRAVAPEVKALELPKD
jgi:hypothetical protein